MYRKLKTLVEKGLVKQVPAVGLGAFRIGFSLVILQEIVFLFYFRHLIFDPVPFFDRASPILHFFLLVWAAIAVCLVLGYHTRTAAVANYVFWVVFVVFTPMWQDFDGGFDQLMTGSSFLLIFLPTERALSLDNLRSKLRYSTPAGRYEPNDKVSVLAYYLPLAISLGLLYLDSGIHKLSASFKRNGMGLASAHHALLHVGYRHDPLLNLKLVEMFIGYTIIVFQLVFYFVLVPPFRVPLYSSEQYSIPELFFPQYLSVRFCNAGSLFLDGSVQVVAETDTGAPARATEIDRFLRSTMSIVQPHGNYYSAFRYFQSYRI